MAFARPARKLTVGDGLRLGLTIEAEVSARGEAGEVELKGAPLAGRNWMPQSWPRAKCRCRPISPGSGTADARDDDDYQTIFARADGVGGRHPPPALHFTPDLLEVPWRREACRVKA